MNRFALMGGGAAVVLAAAYFGLSAYSGKQAEKRLEDWVYDMELDDQLSWDSVSSSPFGGSFSIAGLELDSGADEPAVRIAKVTVSELVDSDERSQVRLRFQGIDAGQEALSGLSNLSRMAGGNLGRAAHNFVPALNSGLMTLKPFDAELFVNVDDDDGSLESELFIGLPELFDSRISYRLDKQRDLNRTLRRLPDDLAEAEGLYQVLGQLGALDESLKRAEIGRITLSVKDRGMLARSVALQQRYNTPLDPTAGNAEGQRQAHYERQVERGVKECERDELGRGLDNVCELLEQVLLGKIDGVELSIEPDEPVRLQDLAKLDNPRTAKRLVERLNPQLSSL